MKRLRVGILDFITNKTTDAWFESHVMLPNYAAIMPQCIGVWAEELGHEVFYETYTGREDLAKSLPHDLDVLFLSCFSRASFLAYAVSNEYRKRGTVTVLGGPHARSFAAHARPYFDYLCQFTDKDTIKSIFQDFHRNRVAVTLNAPAQPSSLPSAREREKFIDRNVQKNVARGFLRTIPMLGSLGCPYTCNFCIDAAVPYKTLPYDQLVDDMRFIEKRWGAENTSLFWHDPNFGVRFKEYMGVIEESGTRLLHGGESSLSLLGEANLKQMQKNRWVVQVPGIESWYGYNGKGGTNKVTGMEKVRKVAEHVNTVLRYVPYVQTNFVLGLDTDEGDEPFELTKAFVDLAPGAFPGYSIVTDFQNSPLSTQLAKEGRTFPMLHPFLDNNFAFNVRIKNYGLADFYTRITALQAHTWGARAMARRYGANTSGYVKVVNAARAVTEGRWRWSHFKQMRARVERDPSFLPHYNGDRLEPPQYYFDVLKGMMGKHWAQLPVELTTPAGFVETVRNTPIEERVIPAEKLVSAAE